MEVIITEAGSYPMTAEIKDVYFVRGLCTSSNISNEPVFYSDRPVSDKTVLREQGISDDDIFRILIHDKKIVAQSIVAGARHALPLQNLTVREAGASVQGFFQNSRVTP